MSSDGRIRVENVRKKKTTGWWVVMEYRVTSILVTSRRVNVIYDIDANFDVDAEDIDVLTTYIYILVYRGGWYRLQDSH